MIEILTVICMYPLTLPNGESKMTPLYGEMVSQNPKLIQVGKQLADGWQIDFTKSLTRLGVLEYNMGVMYINENNCLVKKSIKTNVEPE